MNDVHVNRIVSQRIKSREIVKEILNFGVTEDQKLDIIYILSLSLENNECMREVANILKKYRKNINKDDEEINVISKENKILTS